MKQMMLLSVLLTGTLALNAQRVITYPPQQE